MELFTLLAKLTLDSTEYEKQLDDAEKQAQSFEEPPKQKLELDTSEFEQGVEESQGLGHTFGSEMESVFGSIKTALTATGIVAAITGIVNGIKEAVDLTAQTADQIDKGSRRLGISTKAYQEWDHALRQSGASINDVNKGIMVMQTALLAADPATPFADAEDAVDGLADKTAGLSTDAYEAFRELGMLGDISSGKFKSAEELMSATLMKLAEFTDNGGSVDERGILVRKLFGKGGDSLNALLDSGAEGVQQLLKEASNLGLVMSEDEIKTAVEYGDAVANLNAELEAIKIAFVQDIIPVLKSATEWLTDFLAKLNPRLQTSSLYQVFDDIDKKTLKASNDIDEATVTAQNLITQLESMGDYWTLDEEGRMTWDSLAAKALELFPQLSQYIDKDGKKIQGNTEDILANIKAWGLLEKQRLLATAMEEKQAAVAKQLSDAYEKGAEARKKDAESAGKQAVLMEKMNKILGTENGAGLAEMLGSDTVTEDNFNKAVDLFGSAQFQAFGLGQESREWQKLVDEAGNLRTEAEKMKEEANKAKEGMSDEQKYLMEEMGFTQEEITKVTAELDSYIRKLNEVPSDVYTTMHLEEDGSEDGQHAIGSNSIPYDNYHAILHRGEKVLTASEVRKQEAGADIPHLEERIAAAIRAGMENISIPAYLDGRVITQDINRRNMRDVKARRYNG